MRSPIGGCRLVPRIAVVALVSALAGAAFAQGASDEQAGDAVAATASAPQGAQPSPAAGDEKPTPAEKKRRFTDEKDGRFDCSDYLVYHKGFLPVPFLITEPAVGYGGGLAFAWFRESIAQMEAQSRAAGARMVPPDIAAVMAFKTDNGTAGWGGAYLGHLKDDRVRYLVEAGKADLYLDFYGPRQIPRRFAIKAPLVKADGLFRVGKSDWFVGLRYLYFGASCKFQGATPAVVPPGGLEESVGQASLVVDYDSRDNTLTPSSGTFAEGDFGFARPAFGSSRSFESKYFKVYNYQPIGERFILALRADARFTGGRVPFYAKPYLSLRGIPAMRYQGEDTLLGEVELRWKLDRRWALLGFGGMGKAYGGRVNFSEAPAAMGGGLGFRYLLARKLGLWAGLDVARGTGTGDTAVYFQVGSAWR